MTMFEKKIKFSPIFLIFFNFLKIVKIKIVDKEDSPKIPSKSVQQNFRNRGRCIEKGSFGEKRI